MSGTTRSWFYLVCLLCGAVFLCLSCQRSSGTGFGLMTREESVYNPLDPLSGMAFIADFRVWPQIVQPGQPVMVSWDVKNAKEMYIFARVGKNPVVEQRPLLVPTYDDPKLGFTALPIPHGSTPDAPARSTTYMLSVKGFDDRVFNRFVELIAETSPGDPSIQYFIANDAIVRRGQTTSLRWRAQGCSRIRIRGGLSMIERECLLGPDTVNVQVNDATFYELQLINSEGQIVGMDTIRVDVLEDPPPAFIESFEPSHYTINIGEPIILKWSVKNASGIKLAYDPSLGPNPGAVENLPPAGSIEARPNQDMVYTLIVTSGPNVPPVIRDVRVTVKQRPRIVKFVANPPVVKPGELVTLEWEVAHCKSAELSIPEVKAVPCSGGAKVAPLENANYTLTVVGTNGGTDASTISVAVPKGSSSAPVIEQFFASSTSIVRGQSVTLSWQTRGGQKVELVGHGGGVVDARGEMKVTPLRKKPGYVLKVYGPSGKVEAQQSLDIHVAAPPPKITYFRAAPSVVLADKGSKLYWQTTACAYVRILSSEGERTTQPCGGELPIHPKKTTVYQLIVVGKNGESASASVSINVGSGLSDQQSLDMLSKLLKVGGSR
jgi:hypothetical protein